MLARAPTLSQMKHASHLASFALGVIVGFLVASKCPPDPVPADTDPPPVTAPATSGAK